MGVRGIFIPPGAAGIPGGIWHGLVGANDGMGKMNCGTMPKIKPNAVIIAFS